MRSILGLACLLVLADQGIAGAQVRAHRPVWTAESDQREGCLGSAVAAAGDVNGDGFADLLVGAYSFSGTMEREGQASVYHGSPDGPSKLPDWTTEGGQPGAILGESVGGAGDVNGDGYDDVIVGARQAGYARVFLGSPLGLASSPAWTSNPGGVDYPYDVASAGDVNGDGYDDVLVSDIGFTNDLTREGRVYLHLGSPTGPEAVPAWVVEGNQGGSLFGGSISSAGDVNGDGYADVIVGAAGWNNVQRNEGRAFLYLGSAAGLATSPAWSAESDQDGASFGSRVSHAGDVNGDGFADVIVAASSFDHGESEEGRAFVYLGSGAGLGLAPAWTTESNQFVALAGDVSAADLDGDGYHDVIVGYYALDNGQINEGGAFVFHGSATGLAARPAWLVEGNQRDSLFAYALAGAGDLNGDGYDDLVVGAYNFDADERNEGRAFAYLGEPRRRLR